MQLYIKQKVFSWGDRFTVWDAHGEERYYVQGGIFTWGKKLHVYDCHDREVAFIQQRLLTFLPRYTVSVDGEEVAEIVKEMELNPGNMGLIVNRAPGGQLDAGVMEEIEKHRLKLLGILPQDEGVYRCDCNGEPSAKLPDSNPVKTAVKKTMQSLGL